MVIDQDIAKLRKRIRHSTAHVMADVVTRMYPGTRLAIGPPTDDGFYYDFLSSDPFTNDDLGAIEEAMRETIAEDHPVRAARVPEGPGARHERRRAPEAGDNPRDP